MTRTANASVAPIHDRMPVILDMEEREAWLGGSDDLGVGARTLLRQQPVAAFCIKEEGERLIERSEGEGDPR